MKANHHATLLCVWCLLLASAMLAMAQGPRGKWRPTGERGLLQHDGKDRFYRLHVPAGVSSSKDLRPLLVVLHGGGGNAEVASKMGFSVLADREQFIVVYPEATGGHWNDGRAGEVIVEKAGGNDDVGFIVALVESIQRKHPVDRQRIFVTGFSNGGMMSHRLGIARPDLFAAIAPCIGGIPKPLASEKAFRPAQPISVLILQGTEDPLVPYDGGKVTVNLVPALRGKVERDHGSIASTGDALRLWKKANGILGEPTVTLLPDRDPHDGCRLERSEWREGRGGSSVTLIRMIGAGHTLPGARQYLPEKIIGKTCHDAQAPELIWEFFQHHPKKP